MEAERQAVLCNDTNGSAKDSTGYPLSQALIDLNNYFVAGTIPGALLGITAESGNSITQSKEQIRTIEGRFVEDEAGDALLNFWKPAGTLDKAHDKIMKDWIKANVPGTPPVYVFIRFAQYADARQRAIAALNIP